MTGIPLRQGAEGQVAGRLEHHHDQDEVHREADFGPELGGADDEELAEDGPPVELDEPGEVEPALLLRPHLRRGGARRRALRVPRPPLADSVWWTPTFFPDRTRR